MSSECFERNLLYKLQEERKRDLDAEIAFAKNSYDQLEKQRVQLDEVSAKRMEVMFFKNYLFYLTFKGRIIKLFSTF